MNVELTTRMNPLEEFFSDKKSPKTKKIYRVHLVSST